MTEKTISTKNTSPDPASERLAPPARKNADKIAKAPSPKRRYAARPTVKAAKPVIVKTPKAEKVEKVTREERPKKVKIKLIRDGFTMPENEYAAFDDLKKRCLQAGVHAKKGELLRAALLTLSRLSDIEMVNAVSQIEKLKTGRPARTKHNTT
jgi:hypothetical protein